jgi:hypothetical protein
MVQSLRSVYRQLEVDRLGPLSFEVLWSFPKDRVVEECEYLKERIRILEALPNYKPAELSGFHDKLGCLPLISLLVITVVTILLSL